MFLSNVKRDPSVLSTQPGPGYYELEYKRSADKNTTIGFGSSSHLKERPLSQFNSAFARLKNIIEDKPPT